ncbi:DUF389 domain-containing protein [Rhodococcus sp. X156]|uniref:DUF389 domain-containing protein n=1 Tax=Rhodococcus sp. X156 TaxID=2499145 RepID=UPI000FDAE5D6|nr:DUF389 domain-containing protein [Rhodococcus sp. X156]
MLHLRLRVPADLVDEVLADLEQDDTVTNVAVVPGGFRKPAGTLVLADVARESATAVIGRLRTLKVQHRGSISIEQLDTVLSDDATRAEVAAPGAPDDAVVWESVEQRLRDSSRLSWVFIAFMTIAAALAGVGRITDQPILIVGAMVVGPEFAPIAALCFGFARPRLSMVPLAVRALVVGFAIATMIATIFWWVLFQLGGFTREQATSGPLTDFIVSPDGWSFVVGILAGVAGMLSLTTAKSEVLVGVFISVTTIPALGTVAVCLACGAWGDVVSAAAQLGLNLVAIVLAGTCTLLLQRLIWQRITPTRLHIGR